MTRLHSYIGRTVTGTLIMAVLGCVGLLTIFTFLEQMSDIRNDYTVLHVARFVLYSIPRMFYETIPYAALIGCLSGVGLLAGNSELVVMRAAGISTWSIAWAALKPALVLTILGLLVGEYVLPDFERLARIDRVKGISDAGTITPEFGFWYREGDVYMHFDVVGQSGVLEGITHYEVDEEQNLVGTLFAERAIFHDLGTGPTYWLLEKVKYSRFDRDAVVVGEEPSREWFTALTPNLISAEILVQPDKMSIGELDTKIDYMRDQGLNSAKFELGFWGKVLQPLATIALVLVGVSFVFGPLREATMSLRVFSGLIIGILFRFFQNLLAPASLVFGFSPIVATIIPIVFCFVVGYVLFRRAN
jgi:lipopolysaccharide export system permease protein